MVVIGSGIQAADLSRDTGVALVANSLASAIGLGLIITLFGPLSGAHLNPVVTLTSWWARRTGGEGLGGREALVYTAAQTAGAIGGAVVAELMFGRAPGRSPRRSAPEGTCSSARSSPPRGSSSSSRAWSASDARS